jgi:hypothetical protein
MFIAQTLAQVAQLEVRFFLPDSLSEIKGWKACAGGIGVECRPSAFSLALD